MRIDGWVGGNGGCEWYRVTRPLAMLSSLGYETHLHRPTLDPKAPDVTDVLITQRLHTPQQLAMVKLLRGYGRHALIADFDDDLWRVPRQSPAYRVYGDPVNQQGLRDYARMMDLITVSTEPLAARVLEELGDDAPPVLVIPNAVPDALFLPQGRPAAVPLIGWGGSDTHAFDWQHGGVAAQVDRFLGRRPKWEGVTMGAHYLKVARGRWAWASLEDGSYYRQVSRWTIGLAPLAPTALNAAKSHVKALEYAALGVFPLVSQSPAYAPLGLPGPLTVQTPGDWNAALIWATDLYRNDRPAFDWLVESAQMCARNFAESRVAPLWQEAVQLAHTQFRYHRKAAA